MGLMTCFDAMYAYPFLDLVEKKNISTLVFTTAWQDVDPHLTAIGFHSGLARGSQINYLAANRKYAPKKQGGSGIYTTEAVVNSWSGSKPSSSHMILAEIP